MAKGKNLNELLKDVAVALQPVLAEALGIDELRVKYPNEYWKWSTNGHGEFKDNFKAWLNYWVDEWECESWEALELESRKYCVECCTSKGVTVGQTRGVDGVLIEGVAWCRECGEAWSKYSEHI